MMTHTSNIKLQKLIKYSQIQILKQRNSERANYSEAIDISPESPKDKSEASETSEGQIDEKQVSG